jgi:hypothetical protein
LGFARKYSRSEMLKEKGLFLLHFAHLFVPLSWKQLEVRLHLGARLCRLPPKGRKKYSNKFGISLDLDKFDFPFGRRFTILTLKNANIFAFSSLNRNFALPLAIFIAEVRLHLGNTQINLVFHSIWINFSRSRMQIYLLSLRLIEILH